MVISRSSSKGISSAPRRVADAAEIYRWVDEAGVVHFSDMPSAKASHPFKTVEIEEPRASESPPDGESDREVAAATADSLRAELEALREELRAQREAARERRIQAPLLVVQDPQPVVYGWNHGYGRYHRPSAKPGMPRPRPQPAEIKTATWKTGGL